MYIFEVGKPNEKEAEIIMETIRKGTKNESEDTVQHQDRESEELSEISD